MTAGSVNTRREYTDGIVEGKYYPNHDAIDFYHRYKEELLSLRRWASNAFAPASIGRAFFPDGDEAEPNEKGLKFLR